MEKYTDFFVIFTRFLASDLEELECGTDSDTLNHPNGRIENGKRDYRSNHLK